MSSFLLKLEEERELYENWASAGLVRLGSASSLWKEMQVLAGDMDVGHTWHSDLC